jgi:micrococcal nuclease
VEERDRYGRLLAYVYRARDDLFVNLALVREGYAMALTVPPNVAHTDELVAAARAAREQGRGLWGRCEAQAIPDG